MCLEAQNSVTSQWRESSDLERIEYNSVLFLLDSEGIAVEVGRTVEMKTCTPELKSVNGATVISSI